MAMDSNQSCVYSVHSRCFQSTTCRSLNIASLFSENFIFEQHMFVLDYLDFVFEEFTVKSIASIAAASLTLAPAKLFPGPWNPTP